MIYFEYAINYKLSCLLTISTCILFFNPAGWNVTYVLRTGRRFCRGFLRAFWSRWKHETLSHETWNRRRFASKSVRKGLKPSRVLGIFDQAFLRSRMPSNRREFVGELWCPNWQRSATRIMEAVCKNGRNTVSSLRPSATWDMWDKVWWAKKTRLR